MLMISTTILVGLVIACILGGLHFSKKVKDQGPATDKGAASPHMSAGFLFMLAIVLLLMMVFNLYQVFVLKSPEGSLEKIFL